jgi:hypothetical protein
MAFGIRGCQRSFVWYFICLSFFGRIPPSAGRAFRSNCYAISASIPCADTPRATRHPLIKGRVWKPLAALCGFFVRQSPMPCRRRGIKPPGTFPPLPGDNVTIGLAVMETGGF